MQQPGHYAPHPWGRMPSLRHGAVPLIESAAICRHIDRVFPGPRRVPADPLAEARREQWLTAHIDDIHRRAAREVILRRLGFVPEDAAAMAAGAEATASNLRIVEATLARTPWLAGDAISLADLMLVPLLSW
jgi:glutathione S-transferase